MVEINHFKNVCDVCLFLNILFSCSSCKCRRNITEFGRWKRGYNFCCYAFRRLKKTCNFCLEKKKKIWEERKKMIEEYKQAEVDTEMEFAEGAEATNCTYKDTQYENNSVETIDSYGLAKNEKYINSPVPLRPYPISNNSKNEQIDSSSVNKRILSERQKSVIWLSIVRKNKKYIYSPVYRSFVNASLITPLRKINQTITKQ